MWYYRFFSRMALRMYLLHIDATYTQCTHIILDVYFSSVSLKILSLSLSLARWFECVKRCNWAYLYFNALWWDVLKVMLNFKWSNKRTFEDFIVNLFRKIEYFLLLWFCPYLVGDESIFIVFLKSRTIWKIHRSGSVGDKWNVNAITSSLNI